MSYLDFSFFLFDLLFVLSSSPACRFFFDSILYSSYSRRSLSFFHIFLFSIQLGHRPASRSNNNNNSKSDELHSPLMLTTSLRQGPSRTRSSAANKSPLSSSSSFEPRPPDPHPPPGTLPFHRCYRHLSFFLSFLFSRIQSGCLTSYVFLNNQPTKTFSFFFLVKQIHLT